MVLRRSLKTIQSEEKLIQVPRHCKTEERPKKGRKLQNSHWRRCLMRPYTWDIIPCCLIQTTQKRISSPWKGGDPVAPSSTATLLRIHSSHLPCLRHPLLAVKDACTHVPHSCAISMCHRQEVLIAYFTNYFSWKTLFFFS